MLKALLWKDYRLNRMLLIFGAVILFGPYVVVLLAQWRTGLVNASAHVWAESLTSACMLSMGLSLLTICLLSANVFAGERADRSAEFLASLPASRLAVLLAKGIVVIGTITVIAATQWWVVEMLIPWVDPRINPSLNEPLWFILSVSVLIGGAGWGASSVLSSPVGAAGAAMLAPMAVLSVVAGLSWKFGFPPENSLATWCEVVCLLSGLASFVGFSVAYVRRRDA